ncbi:targeting protein for Xklp2 [Macrosteles quadrilineatus]|uniref:targeting protein for Xklp2 n=1 Tax=Macrosteles quadrilineatus TaxID=74068 RepID=UPI0023E090D4|nr:targeting protein for Xklp2 [Macrosteles quadrilineatus]
MANVYEYHAPQFRDFNSGFDDSDEADKFFDVEDDPSFKDDNKENEKNSAATNVQIEVAANDNERKKIIKTSSTGKHDHDQNKEKEISNNNSQSTIKRESSEVEVSDTLSQDLKNISLRTRKRTHFDGIEIKTDIEKQHSMVTRNDEKIKTPKIELRTRSIAKDADLNKNRKRKSTYAEEMRAPEKYMAMAEHILHYQRDTPPRFHSHKRQSIGKSGTLLKRRQSYKPRRTIALTPKLMTLQRSRPVEAPSLEQREQMELEEMKKHQIKAHPMNEKIFMPPKLPPKPEKSKTEPAPFNLTQVPKKMTQIEDEPYKFTAKPAPKAIFEKPVGVAPKKELPITVPESPAITKPTWAHKRVKVAAISNEFQESTEDLTSFGVPMPEFIPKRTEVKPFSFEVRDKKILEKKEKKMKEIIEAEKKMREFKAKPMPAFIASKDTTISSSQKSHLNCSKMSLTSVKESEEPTKSFKARSPRVLRKEPFKPVTEHAHSEPLDIQLHTDRRALERQEFEMKKAEKEQELAGLKQLMEMQKKEQEEAETAKIRKETVHKAQPMPKFKPVPLNPKTSSKVPLTLPQSPRFTKRTRTTTMCSSKVVKK